MKTAAAILSIFSLTSVIRYGLVLILIDIGLLKFTKHEAEAILSLAENKLKRGCFKRQQQLPISPIMPRNLEQKLEVWNITEMH